MVVIFGEDDGPAGHLRVASCVTEAELGLPDSAATGLIFGFNQWKNIFCRCLRSGCSADCRCGFAVRPVCFTASHCIFSLCIIILLRRPPLSGVGVLLLGSLSWHFLSLFTLRA